MKKRLVVGLVMIFVLMITGCGNLNSTEEPIGADSQITDNDAQTYTEGNATTESISEEIGAASNVTDENTITFTGTIIQNAIDTKAATISVKSLEDEFPFDAVFFELPDDEAGWGLRIGAVVTITCKDSFSEGLFGTLISITDATIDNSAIPFTEEQIEEAKGIAFDHYADTVFTVNSIEYLEENHYVNGIDCCNFIVSVSAKGDAQPDRTISLQLDNGVWEIVIEWQ